MRITCLQENLSRALLLANRIVSQKIQLPILSNVLLVASKNSFSVWATDLEMGIKIETPAKIEEEGEITVPAKIFYELVAALQPGQVELETQETNLLLKTKNQKATFAGTPAVEFPRFDNNKQTHALSIKKQDLRKIVKSVCFASAIDDTRPVLSGVLFKSDGGQYTFVATDGYRLSFKKIKSEFKDANTKLIVLNRVLKELSFLVEKTGEDTEDIDIFLTPEENQIRFVAGENIVVGRLIEGEFPAYEKIIPQNTNTTVVFDREDLLNSVKTASIFARDSANIVKITIKGDSVLISANAPQVGENESKIEVKTTGEENEIAFNSRFLLEFLASIDEKEIIFEMTGPLNPGVFKLKNEDSFFHLIMPVRIQE